MQHASHSIDRWRNSIEAELSSAIDDAACSARLKAAMRYAVFPGGKRIRPIFALSFCSDLGGDPEPLVRAACALELLHCASLVHDDLPALDDDAMRRGKPATHIEFGESTALLAGDALVPLAFSLVTKSGLDSAAKEACVGALGRAYLAVCSGQLRDIDGVTRETMTEIYREKTGALFGAAARLGAIAAGESGPRGDRAEDIGTSIGVAFQLRDDKIDRSAEKGRGAGSDERKGKFTSESDRAASSELERTLHREITTGIGEIFRSAPAEHISRLLNSLQLNV